MGKTETLKATITPSNATNKDVTWSSSNTSIATVDSTGKVTPKKDGFVKITAKSVSNPNVNYICRITVKTKITKIELDRTILMIDNKYYNFAELTATLTPNKDATIQWSSSDPGIATVDKNGKVVGKKYGTTKITATVKNDDGTSVKAECKLKVISSSNDNDTGNKAYIYRNEPFYLVKGSWGNEYVEAYVNNIAKIVKKYQDSTYKSEAAQRTIYGYIQNDLKVTWNSKTNKMVVTGHIHRQEDSVKNGEFKEIPMVKTKGEISPNNYVILFTAKNQWIYLLEKNTKTGDWKVINSKESSAGCYRDGNRGWWSSSWRIDQYCSYKFNSQYGLAMRYQGRGARNAGTKNHLLHKDTRQTGIPTSNGCIHLGDYSEKIYYDIMEKASVGTRMIQF